MLRVVLTQGLGCSCFRKDVQLKCEEILPVLGLPVRDPTQAAWEQRRDLAEDFFGGGQADAARQVDAARL